MANGFFDQMIDDEINEYVNQCRKEGVCDEEIMRRIENIDFENYFIEATNSISRKNSEYFVEKMHEIALEEKETMNEFLIHQEQLWGKCFDASLTMYVLTLEAAENYGKLIVEKASVEEKKNKQYTFLALQHLHGRACQVFLEILYLLKGGFADCAYARWRTLYELSCMAYFIKNQNEKIAKQFILQSESDDQQYSWTKGAKDKDGKEYNYKSFHKIERFCEMGDLWRKEYKTSCLVNHASPQGTFKRVSVLKPTEVISVGQSDYGIALPASHSAISLHFITSIFFSVFSSVDSLVYIKTLKLWVKKLCEWYNDVDNTFSHESE